MTKNVTPMIHVPDVERTAEWYVSIGFELTGSNTEDGEMNWARLVLGEGSVMFSCPRGTSEADRPIVDV